MFMMVLTTLAMIGCGFTEAVARSVIRGHFVAMFAPCFSTGFLIERFGTTPTVSIGLIFLTSAAVTGASGLSAGQFYGALILLGIGWNFRFIGSTTMLTEAVGGEDRPVAQGVNDTMIALVSTTCAFASGAVSAGFGGFILPIVTLVFVSAPTKLA